MDWNLRWVLNAKRGELVYHVREVFYDDEDKPVAYSSARWRDMLRYCRDWIVSSADRLIYPIDFDGTFPKGGEVKPFKGVE